MQGDATVIQYLNAVLRNEMTAVNQYFLMPGCWITGVPSNSWPMSTRSRSRAVERLAAISVSAE